MYEIVQTAEADDVEFNPTSFLKKGLLTDENYDFDHDAFPISKLATTRCERAVLQQICFWYAKAKTVRNGLIWMIHPADEFQKFGVDYKLDTIRKAIRSLVNAGVLVTERHFHPYRQISAPVLWIRPNVAMFDDTRGKMKKKVQPYALDYSKD